MKKVLSPALIVSLCVGTIQLASADTAIETHDRDRLQLHLERSDGAFDQTQNRFQIQSHSELEGHAGPESSEGNKSQKRTMLKSGDSAGSEQQAKKQLRKGKA